MGEDSTPSPKDSTPTEKVRSAEGYRKLIAYLAALAGLITLEYLKVGDPYAVAATLAVYIGGNSAEHFAKRRKP